MARVIVFLAFASWSSFPPAVIQLKPDQIIRTTKMIPRSPRKTLTTEAIVSDSVVREASEKPEVSWKDLVWEIIGDRALFSGPLAKDSSVFKSNNMASK